MANYIKTGPFTNGAAPGISASFLNSVENVFVQPSGGTESGHYFLSGWSNASGDLIQAYIPTLSRTATPVSLSCTFDTSDKAATNVNAPALANITSGGFQIYTTSTSAQVSNLQVGGNWTMQY